MDKFTPINPYAKLHSPYSAKTVSSAGSAPAAKTEKAGQMAEFSQLLMSMFSTNSLGLGGDDSESGAAGGSNMNTMMMPLMLSLLEKLQSLDAASATESSGARIPVEGADVTQEFNAGHHAIDFGVVEGTPVKSTMSGKVVYSGWNDEGYGNLVVVESGSRRTYYAHLSEIPVSVGQTVRSGDVIGLSGNTGNSTGPHLHYEVRVNGQTIDPSGELFGSSAVV